MRTPEVERAFKVADIMKLDSPSGQPVVGMTTIVDLAAYARKLEGLASVVAVDKAMIRAEKAEAAPAEEKKKSAKADNFEALWEKASARVIELTDSLVAERGKRDFARQELDDIDSKLRASTSALDACREAREKDRDAWIMTEQEVMSWKSANEYNVIQVGKLEAEIVRLEKLL